VGSQIDDLISRCALDEALLDTPESGAFDNYSHLTDDALLLDIHQLAAVQQGCCSQVGT
jgi:hypothetical protein